MKRIGMRELQDQMTLNNFLNLITPFNKRLNKSIRISTKWRINLVQTRLTKNVLVQIKFYEHQAQNKNNKSQQIKTSKTSVMSSIYMKGI